MMNDDNDDVYDRLATPSRTSPRLMINTSWLHNFHEGGGGGGYNRKEFSVRKTVYFIYLFIYFFLRWGEAIRESKILLDTRMSVAK